MNLPPLFLARIKQQIGDEAFSQFLEGYQQPPHHGLRIHKGEVLFKHLLHEQVPWHSKGYYHQSTVFDGNHPYHHAGAFYFQEPSAMAVVPLLDVQPDDFVLDIAAAPGGKSTDIASRLSVNGLLVANDVETKRAQTLMFNVERLGLSQAIVTQHDPNHLPVLFPHFFDKILLDAPCSGEGMFRKDADAVGNWSPANVTACALRQEQLLINAVKLLKPGGRIVYATCTFAPEENEVVIEKFLTSHPEFKLMNIPIGESHSTRGYGVKLWPHLVKGEGHFIAVLQHQGEKPPMMQFTHKMRNPQSPQWLRFAKATLTSESIQPNFALDTRLFLIPLRYQFHRALHTLRAGVLMGEVEKDIFYPSHHLAHYLTKEDVQRSINLTLDDPRLFIYLRGEEIPSQVADGWVLITVDELSLGWGKASQGRIKNHYPKGLRLNQGLVKR